MRHLRWIAALTALVMALAVTPMPAFASGLTPKYARSQIRRLINDRYYVNRGPYVYNCRGSSLYIKCDVDFRAGVYWHCGYGSVKLRGGYVYTRLLAPIGC